MQKKLFILLFGFVMVGCASTPPAKYFPPPNDYVPLSQIVIPVRFGTVDLSKNTVVDEALRCVPSLVPSGTAVQDLQNKFPLPNNMTTATSHVSSSSHFVINGSKGTCVRQSANKYPIWAAEALYGTANPAGLPPDVLNGWYTQIAQKIAINGQANVAYVLSNGNVYLASYWADPNTYSPITIFYSSEFKKKGEWSISPETLRFEHPNLLSFSVTKRSDRMQKNVLADVR